MKNVFKKRMTALMAVLIIFGIFLACFEVTFWKCETRVDGFETGHYVLSVYASDRFTRDICIDILEVWYNGHGNESDVTLFDCLDLA